MTSQAITCPSCQTVFKLDESLAAPLLEATRKEYERKLAAKDALIVEREAKLKADAEALKKEQAAFEEKVATRIGLEKARIAAEEQRKARLAVETDLKEKAQQLADLNEVIKARNEKLATLQSQQAELLKKERELEDARRELELTVQTKVQGELAPLREKAATEAEERFRLQIIERDEEKALLQRKVEELQRKLSQGSQQLQGEALELELESLLRARFPADIIEPVGKGQTGGDVRQIVMSPAGQKCGTILWESKRTKNWSDAWLPKLREDQRSANADIALMISEALPKGVTNFELIDGVYVAGLKCAIPMGAVLRQSLIDLAAARKSMEGQQTKAEMVYNYLTGTRFRQRIEAIVERYQDMQDDLRKERAFYAKQWAKRETSLQAMMDATVGMYGDLQGIAGSALVELEPFDVPKLPAAAE